MSVRKGATTVCEDYECGSSASQSMKMLGSWDKFFYRNLAGIASLSPGYRKVLIQPLPLGDLRSVSASEKTVRGTVNIEWTREATAFDLKVSIPAGMESDIAIPSLGLKNVRVAEGNATVWESGVYAPGRSGLTGATANGDAIVFHSGSGLYHFTLSGLASEP